MSEPASMLINERFGVTRRLLAAALSLVLVLASVMSAYAHAGHNSHHHPATTIDSGASDTTRDHAVGDARSDHTHDGATNDHGSCGDLLCHGGFAVLSSADSLIDLDWCAVRSVAADRTANSDSLSTIERPPKASVLA